MAIKKLQKSTENQPSGGGIKPAQELSDHDPFDLDGDDLLPVVYENSNIVSHGTATVKKDLAVSVNDQPVISYQAAALAEAHRHPCYGNLVNPPTAASHWHAQQVQAELKVVLRGFSNRNKWWKEELASKLIQQACGLQEGGHTLCWVVDPDDFDSYLMLEDIREHMKYAFGDRFLVLPVSELSEDAKGWKFQLNA